jgi:hypothetical protein
MAYVTCDQVKGAIDTDRLTQLAEDPEKTVEEILADAIGAADSIINGKIQAVMDVPVTIPQTAVDFLSEISLKIVVHRLYSRRHDVPEDVQKGFEWGQKELDNIRDGKTTFEITSKPNPGVTVYHPYDQPVFPKGFIK